MVLCQCVGVTDTTIKEIIANGARTLGEISRRCGAGRCCLSCREEICALLYTHVTPTHTEDTLRSEGASAPNPETQREATHEGQRETHRSAERHPDRRVDGD